MYFPRKLHAVMIRYTSANQLTLEGFEHPFERDLDKNNRWVKLAEALPWDSLANVYARKLRSDSGRFSVDVRMVIGALIVKHKLCLSDRETVELISEHIYLQYFCGLKCFATKKPFDASLFVDIRKRMGAASFDEFNNLIITTAESYKPKRKQVMAKSKSKIDDLDSSPLSIDVQKIETANTEKQDLAPKGTLKIDATIADQNIKYPTDLNLLNDSREEAERIIDILFQSSGQKKKPRDYRRIARKDFLNISKKKKRSKQIIRRGIRQQLQYLRRDIKIIHTLLNDFEGKAFPLKLRDQRIFWVIQHIYEQQQYMYDNKTNSHQYRIVNIYQPWVRPMVRGKEKNKVEFGSKINISEIDGFCKLNHLSWEAYNESKDLIQQVEDYHALYGRYPELLLADQIYLNRENRAFLKSKGIRIVNKPLGRPPKQELNSYQKRKQTKERNQRNHVEAKIGQGKTAYQLNNIKAKRMDTSTSWISAILFIMNIVRLEKLIKTIVFFWLKFIQAIKQHKAIMMNQISYALKNILINNRKTTLRKLEYNLSSFIISVA